ncbi:alpha/beta hydrolase [Actinomadura rifamycini]|uniref:alpha/beta hydrolase n=1 Tax=Actinomadura rifamycini TaxID=31962 RepID=UPI00041FBAF8|nr:alpha/beta hydrolase [Actinomadura rifamycini]
MVSFAQLRDAEIGELDSAWRAWRKLVEHLEQAEDVYQGKFLKGVRGARWQGADAEAAMRTLLPVRTRIRVASGEASAVASVLNTAQGRFRAAQNDLKSAIVSAESQYLKVGHDGSIDFPESLPARYSDWQELQKVARDIQGKFVAAVKKATVADNEIAGALRALRSDVLDGRNPLAGLRKDAGVATGLAGFDPAGIPPRDLTSPKEVADWWRGLPEEQRHLMMNAYPDKIGWLDGIPSEDRDEANRTRLESRLAELHAKGGGISEFERRDLQRLEKLNIALTTYENKGHDLYLLGIDSTRTAEAESRDGEGSDGRAIVAFGNPDHAVHSAAYVPGTTENLDRFTGSMHRAYNLYEATRMYADGPVSTIAWLGYDAPDDIKKDSPFGNYANEGGPQFNSFIDGLRESQAGAGNGGAHMTAVGHSYGSTVIGEAARHPEDRLPVDDIVVAGSPGMRVAHADALGIEAGHVWAQEAYNDPVPSVGRYGHGGGGYIPGIASAVGTPNVPSDEDFGGRRLVTDGEGHSSYWRDRDPEKNEDVYSFSGSSRSLDQQARVIAGTYDDHDPGNDPTQ